MSDDLNKVKRDRNRISLKQPWEVAYMRRSAEKAFKELDILLKQPETKGYHSLLKRLKRICRFAILASKELNKRKK